MSFSLPDYLQSCRQEVESYLESALPKGDTFPQPLFEAMRYSLFAGGKRIRPAFCYAAQRAVGGSHTDVTPFAAALEMIHSYSLIHDDLPAMDDDDLRRGKPTNHKVYGEGMAILAGDALLTDAFAVATHPHAVSRLSPERVTAIIREIAVAAGTGGMVTGQALDLVSTGREVDLPTLEFLHVHKTGALIRAAVRVGGLAAGADPQQLQHLSRYAERIGLAFQVADDVLDIAGDPDTLGKPVGSDAGLKKATYPALLGLEQARQRASELMEEALDALRFLDGDTDALTALARFVVEREY